eukprot:2992513-Amphidinium_carterae.1
MGNAHFRRKFLYFTCFFSSLVLGFCGVPGFTAVGPSRGAEAARLKSLRVALLLARSSAGIEWEAVLRRASTEVPPTASRGTELRFKPRIYRRKCCAPITFETHKKFSNK